jgi:uncharacterized membrane protein
MSMLIGPDHVVVVVVVVVVAVAVVVVVVHDGSEYDDVKEVDCRN